VSDETLRAFSAEATTRADRTMNDYVYAFDLRGKTTLYASDLAKVIADRDDLLAALEALVPQLCEGVEDGCGKLSRHDCAACEGFVAIAKARGQS